MQYYSIVKIEPKYQNYAANAENFMGFVIITEESYVTQSQKNCPFVGFELLKDGKFYSGSCVKIKPNGQLEFTGEFCSETGM